MKRFQKQYRHLFCRMAVSVMIFSAAVPGAAVKTIVVQAEGAAGETTDQTDQTEQTEPEGETKESSAEGTEQPVVVVNREALQAAVEEAVKRMEEQDKYMPSGIESLAVVLESAKRVYADEQSDQAAVDEAVTALNTAIGALRLKSDKEALRIAINTASVQKVEIYTNKTSAPFVTALETARTVYADPEADQIQVDNATSALSTATQQLAVKADKASLKKLLDEANALDSELYTAATYKKVTTAIKNAQKVYDDGDASQKEADSVIQKLKTAIGGLLPEPQPYKVDTKTNTYYYNVLDFGANGSDSANDYTALQAALDKARADRKLVVVVPAGTYYISKTLYIQSNTTLQLDAKAVIRRTESAMSTANMLKTADAKHKCTTYYGYTLAHDITVTGGTWDGGNIAAATATKDLIYFGHCENITISNTTIKNCYGAHALEFAGVRNSVIRGCSFTGFRYDTDWYTSEAIQLDICYKSGSEQWAPGYTADKTTCKNIVIENNVITDYPRGIGSHHVLKGYEYENITIRNNQMLRSSASTQGKCMVGVFLMGAKNVTVSKNLINHYYYGIMIKQSTKLSVKNNKLKYNETANLVYESCDVSDLRARFTVTTDKVNTKKLVYTCSNLKSGYVKTGGKTYRFKKKAKKHTVKLKSKIKSNQKMTFYGKDKSGNQYYRIYYVSN